MSGWHPVEFNTEAGNPVIAKREFKGATLRMYQDGMFDATDGPGFSLSPGFQSEREMLDWIILMDVAEGMENA